MNEASKQLNHAQIQSKVLELTPNQLANQQNTKIKDLLNTDSKNLEKMKYYDSLLNIQRKCNHFNNLFLKIRLKIIHKPFIILDMLKILDDNRSPFDIFMCLYIRLRNTKKRKGFDAMLKFVEHKNELVDTWVYFAEKLLDRQKRDAIKEIKARKKEKKKEVDRSKIMKRSLTFLFSVMGNFVRRNMRDGFKLIKRRKDQVLKKEQGDVERERNFQKKKLDIAASENFFLHKFEKKAVEPEIKIVEVTAKPDPVDFEVVNTNSMFHHVPERRGQMNAYLDSQSQVESEEDREKDSRLIEQEKSKRSLENQQRVMLGQVNQKIKDIRTKLLRKPSDQMLALDEEIELLSELTQLLGLLKNYYEYIMDNPKFRDSKQTRKNFEQIMDLTKNIIDKLLFRIESENQKRQHESSKNLDEDSSSNEKKKRQSLLHIDTLNRNLKQELEDLEKFLDFKTNEDEDDESGHTTEGNTSAEDMPDANGINNLLQEMLNNLGQMNNTMQNQQVVEEEDHESDAADYTQCNFPVFFRKIFNLEHKRNN